MEAQTQELLEQKSTHPIIHSFVKTGNRILNADHVKLINVKKQTKYCVKIYMYKFVEWYY